MILGKYELVGEIGRGEAGASWLAFDPARRCDVVVKVLRADDVATPAQRARFEDGAAAVARLAHANAERVCDFGLDPVAGPFVVKERYQGEDLGHRLERVGRAPLATLVPWITQAAWALAAAHAQGVTHGAVHPGNLLLTRAEGEEAARLLDFRVVPAPVPAPYASPEARRGAPTDARSDLWQLGAVAWHALVGAAPGAPADPAAAPPALGPAVDAFFARALAPDPARRFQTAREFAVALGGLAAGAQAARTHTVLVIDDEPDAALLIRHRFRQQIRKGTYEFVFAANGAEALRVLGERSEIDTVLSDINMPLMDGLAFLACARDQRAHLKVIMVSAYGDMQNIRAAMNRGAFDFVTKPVDFVDLEATLQKALGEVATLREALRQRADAERARDNLARYFPPNLVDLLAAQDMSFRAGVRTRATVLFADIAGFTPLAETMAPESVLALLREFHRRMEAEVFGHGGTLEKYIGDALLAVFGMPRPGARDTAGAIACARAMQSTLDGWNQVRVARGEPPLRVGIGLHQGTVVVGDIGSERNMAVVAIGDTVNVASRVQSITRDVDASVAITQQVIDALRAELGDDGAAEADALLAGFVDLGDVAVRGRSARLHVWKLPRDAGDVAGATAVAS